MLCTLAVARGFALLVEKGKLAHSPRIECVQPDGNNTMAGPRRTFQTPSTHFFIETPLRVDNLEGSAMLAREAPMQIAAGEWLNTRFEFLEMIDRGQIDVAQPNIGRAWA